MWNTFETKPQSGSRIVALFDDGSGAKVFLVHDNGVIDGDGEEWETVGKDFDRWAYLPDGFELFFERAMFPDLTVPECPPNRRRSHGRF